MIVAEGHPAQVACRVLGVSESGFYGQRNRAPSERDVRYAMLTDLIAQVHAESFGTYCILRVHAELTLGRGVDVGHNQVELLMRRAGLQSLTGRRKWKRVMPDNIATDLVERSCHRRHHRTGACSLGGFFVIMFVYVGLTQPPWTSLWLVAPATGGWLLLNRPLDHIVMSKLPVTAGLWILLAELLSRVTAQRQADQDRLAELAAHAQKGVVTGELGQLTNRTSQARLVLSSPVWTVTVRLLSL